MCLPPPAPPLPSKRRSCNAELGHNNTRRFVCARVHCAAVGAPLTDPHLRPLRTEPRRPTKRGKPSCKSGCGPVQVPYALSFFENSKRQNAQSAPPRAGLEAGPSYLSGKGPPGLHLSCSVLSVLPPTQCRKHRCVGSPRRRPRCCVAPSRGATSRRPRHTAHAARRPSFLTSRGWLVKRGKRAAPANFCGAAAAAGPSRRPSSLARLRCHTLVCVATCPAPSTAAAAEEREALQEEELQEREEAERNPGENQRQRVQKVQRQKRVQGRHAEPREG